MKNHSSLHIDQHKTSLRKRVFQQNLNAIPDPGIFLGDLNVAAALYRALTIDTKRWPRTQAWLHRCWERPAAKRARAMREGNRPA
jgi:hypothetical protein